MTRDWPDSLVGCRMKDNFRAERGLKYSEIGSPIFDPYYSSKLVGRLIFN